MGKTKSNQEFNAHHPYVVICEGVDGKNFLIQYLNYLVKAGKIPDEYEAYDFGGNEDINKKLQISPSLKNFAKMKAILIVRDAEMDAAGAVTSLQQVCNTAFKAEVASTGDFAYSGTYEGLKIGFYLWPGLRQGQFQSGTLEDICNELLCAQANEASTSELRQQTKDYITAIEQSRGERFRRRHKNSLHTIFAGTDRFVGMKIGEAAKAGAFDFSAPPLQVLERRICMMSNK